MNSRPGSAAHSRRLSASPPSVCIAIQDRLLRETLRAWLASIAFATESASLADALAKSQPGARVFVVDQRELTETERSYLPGILALGSEVVVISDQLGSYSAGVRQVDRAQGAECLKQAVQASLKALSGRSPRVQESDSAYDRHPPLSDRQLAVAHLVASGFTNQAIADKLGIKEQSVKNAVSVILGKLRCENRVQVSLRMSQLTSRDSG